MSLFNQLLRLHSGSTPLEDFFTEVVAYLFNTEKEILYAWLKHCDLADDNYSDAYVRTQESYESLEHHYSGSRPDFVISLIDGDNRDLIFVESKIGSTEGYQQLLRYAKILDQLPDFRHKYLVYITRDFDPKDEAGILQQVSTSDIQFEQLRWHQFYRFLTSQKEKGMLVQEIIEFMQEYNMAHNNQFSSIDIVALVNFPKSLRLMEATMWGEVEQRFKQVLGGISYSSTNGRKKKALTEMQDKGRYIMSVWMDEAKWWCGLGFFLGTSDFNDYPTVYLFLEIDPHSNHRAEIIDAMKNIREDFGWSGYELNDERAWSGIRREQSLQNFISQEDHVDAIKQFFLERLDELEVIKGEYPHLLWLATPNNDEDIEDELSV